MRQISYTIPGIAVPWARAGRSGKNSYTPPKQADFMCAVRTYTAAQMKGAAPMAGPINLELVAVYPWPKSMSKRQRNEPHGHFKATRPDLDNLVKLVKDAMQGIAYRDDGQVATTLAAKLYADEAKLSVIVSDLAEMLRETS